MEEQHKFERKEYDDILNVIKAGNEYSFENFLAMVDRIRKPFTCFIEGHEVSITQDDAAIMMEKSVMKEITDSLFHAGEKRPNSSAEEQAKKKQRQGTQAVHTEKGANGITALHQTTKRDERQNQVTTKKKIDSLKREMKQVEAVLAALTTHKNKFPQSYWTIDQSTSQADLCLFLCMFSPDCGLFTKCKNEQWKFVEENVLQVLSKAAVDAMDEQFTRRRATLQEQLDEAQRDPLAEDEDDEDENDEDPRASLHEQDPDLAGMVITEDAGRNV